MDVAVKARIYSKWSARWHKTRWMMGQLMLLWNLCTKFKVSGVVGGSVVLCIGD